MPKNPLSQALTPFINAIHALTPGDDLDPGTRAYQETKAILDDAFALEQDGQYARAHELVAPQMEKIKAQLPDLAKDPRNKGVVIYLRDKADRFFIKRTLPGSLQPADSPGIAEHIYNGVRIPVAQVFGARETQSRETTRTTDHGCLSDPVFVAKATKCKVSDVQVTLPLLLQELKKRGITDSDAIIATLATVAVESGFMPKEEAWYASPKKREEYFKDKQYANPDPVTKQQYFGRGHIQLTHKYNYEKYGNKIGEDLVNHPEKMLEPETAAAVTAEYIADHGISELAKAGKWQTVRKRVNGGLNGYTTFKGTVDALQTGIRQQP